MFALTLAALGFAAIPLPAGSVGEVASCVADRTIAADATHIADSAMSGEGLSADGEAIARLRQNVEHCTSASSANEEQTERAALLSVTLIAGRTFESRLASAGVDVSRLDSWFAAQSEEFRTRAFVDMDEQRAVQALQTVEGVFSAELTESQARLIGAYVAARVMANRATGGFPLP